MKFSIITATKDRPGWMPRCMVSVLAQTHMDWEHIILDGSREPGLFQVPNDPRVRYIYQPNFGPAEAFQLALDQVTGEIVHPFSDDDRLAPEALAIVDRALTFISQPSFDGFVAYDWLYGRTAYQDDRGRTLFHLGDEFNLDRLRQGYYLGGAIYWRKELTDELGGFDPDFDGAADYDLYLRFAEHVEPLRLEDVLYLYTDWQGTDSHVRASNQQAQTARIIARAREGVA